VKQIFNITQTYNANLLRQRNKMKFTKITLHKIYYSLVFSFCSTFTPLPIFQPINAQTLTDQHPIIESSLRTDQDREMDSRRKPLEMLNFIQAKSGMKALDIFSGGGYTAQLLAVAVGPSGQVVAMNTKPSLALQQRLLAHPQSNLIPVVSDLLEITQGASNQFDIITIVNSYHDMVNISPDILATNRRIYDLLKPGGVLIIRDHAAKDGADRSVTKTLHRIEPKSVLIDFESVGFKKINASDEFLKNLQDTKETHSNQMQGIQPEGFIYKFIKP